jgi:hypothetical protein
MRAASEVEHIAIAYLMVDADRWCRRQASGNLRMQAALKVGEVGQWTRPVTANDRCVQYVCDHHLNPAHQCRQG